MAVGVLDGCNVSVAIFVTIGKGDASEDTGVSVEVLDGKATVAGSNAGGAIVPVGTSCDVDARLPVPPRCAIETMTALLNSTSRDANIPLMILTRTGCGTCNRTPSAAEALASVWALERALP